MTSLQDSFMILCFIPKRVYAGHFPFPLFPKGFRRNENNPVKMLQSFFVNHLCHRCCSCCRCGVAVVAFFLVRVVVDGGGDGVGGVRVGVGGVRAGVGSKERGSKGRSNGGSAGGGFVERLKHVLF